MVFYGVTLFLISEAWWSGFAVVVLRVVRVQFLDGFWWLEVCSFVSTVDLRASGICGASSSTT